MLNYYAFMREGKITSVKSIDEDKISKEDLIKKIYEYNAKKEKIIYKLIECKDCIDIANIKINEQSYYKTKADYFLSELRDMAESINDLIYKIETLNKENNNEN